jgi:hypothetical protein
MGVSASRDTPRHAQDVHDSALAALLTVMLDTLYTHIDRFRI